MCLVLIEPLQVINDVQFFCLRYRCEAFERLRRYEDSLKDCNLLICVCPGEVDYRASARLAHFRNFFSETKV